MSKGKEEDITRICVKGLGLSCSDSDLRDHFKNCGEITDSKIMMTKSGKSRQFGFVGFRCSESVNSALRKSRSFLGSSQIRVEIALPPQSQELNRPWSRYSEGSSRYGNWRDRADEKRERRRDRKKEGKRKKKEKKISERVATRSTGGRLWDDDVDTYDTQRELNRILNTKDNDEEEEEEELGEQFVEKRKKKKKKKKKGEKFEPNKGNVSGVSGMSDLEYLNSMMVEDEEFSALKTKSKTKDLEKREKKKLEIDEGRLFVRNLSFTTTEEDLSSLFSPYGEISEIYLPIDSRSKRPVGYAFITFLFPEKCKVAVKGLQGKYFQGRFLHILQAYEKPNTLTEDNFKGIKSGFKKSQKVQKKKSAGSSVNWNTLFVNQKTALNKITKQLGVKKSELIDVNSNNAPVRIALAETEAIRQTKEELQKYGIDFSTVFEKESTKVRSKTLILVKNIPSDTSVSELKGLFGKYGNLRDVMIPKIGTMAVISFGYSNEAKTAFNNLSYKNFKNSPLYLEWAPIGNKDEDKFQKKKKIEKKLIQNAVEKEKTENDSSLETATLFVKNLNFKTDEKELLEMFKVKGKVIKCSVARDPLTRRSKGFGFVTYSKIKEAIKAEKELNGVKLNGFELKIEYKRISRNEKNQEEKKISFNKLLVKNLAFEANLKDVTELFSTFGEIKDVRIPRKVAGGHRGFAFVEFLSAQDAANAKLALQHTHLFGRSLVLEYAVDDTSIESIRKSVVNEMKRKRKREKEFAKQREFSQQKKRRKFKR